jgi:hypothetical protein
MSTDVLDRLAAANPVRAPGRAGSAPTFAPEAPRKRKLVIVAVAVLGGVVAAGSALAIGLGAIDFSSAEHAPPRVVKDFDSLRSGAPPGMDPGVIAVETRQIRIGGRTLWIAPTRSGGLCYGWAHGTGGCDKVGTVPLSVSWLQRPFAAPGRGHAIPLDFYAVTGFAHSRWVDAVEVRLDDGTAVRPELAWISKPIEAGFFFYVAPSKRSVVEVVGLRDGEAVTGEESSFRPGPHPYAQLDERRQLAQIHTHEGPVVLWSAPTLTNGRCVWLEFHGEERAVTPCLPTGYERQAAFSGGVHDFGDTTVLAGECGYAALAIVRPGGTSRTIECLDGVVFARLEPADLGGTVHAVDENGNPIGGSSVPVVRLRVAVATP